MPRRDRTTTQEKPLITLHAVTTGAASAQMAISWCAHEGLAERIQAAGFKEPRLLIVTRYKQASRFDDFTYSEWRDSQYQVVKLQRGMAHVTFSRPGINQVFALLVDVADEGSRKQLRDLIRERYGRSSRESVWDDEDRELTGGFRTDDIRYANNVWATAEVDVDPELFAKPLAPWRVWVLKRVFNQDSVRDECQARKRSLIFGPALLPFFVFGAWLSWIWSLVFLLLGFYKFPVELLKRPFSSTTKDWFSRSNLFDRNFIYQTRDGDDRHPVLWLLSPHVLAALPAITFGIMNLPVHYHNSKHRTHPLLDWGWWHTVLVVDGLYVALIAVAVLATLATPFVVAFLMGGQPAKKKRSDYDWEALQRQLELVACGDQPVESITDLSLRQLTPRLVFNAVKVKVCKPFAS